jgi:hypothetical protein
MRKDSGFKEEKIELQCSGYLLWKRGRRKRTGVGIKNLEGLSRMLVAIDLRMWMGNWKSVELFKHRKVLLIASC